MKNSYFRSENNKQSIKLRNEKQLIQHLKNISGIVI